MTLVAYDATLKRPGCALVQAALGGTIGNADLGRMNAWLLAPSPDMMVYKVTNDELDQLVAITNTTHPERSRA